MSSLTILILSGLLQIAISADTGPSNALIVQPADTSFDCVTTTGSLSQWYYKQNASSVGNTITCNTKFVCTQSPPTYTLTIVQADTTNAGVYMCFLTANQYQASLTVLDMNPQCGVSSEGGNFLCNVSYDMAFDTGNELVMWLADSSGSAISSSYVQCSNMSRTSIGCSVTTDGLTQSANTVICTVGFNNEPWNVGSGSNMATNVPQNTYSCTYSSASLSMLSGVRVLTMFLTALIYSLTG